MEISVSKYNNQSVKESENFEITDYKILLGDSNLLLVRDGTMEVDEDIMKKDASYLEIYKVQFIASCQTKLKNGIIVAFFIGEYCSLETYVLGGLPPNYYPHGDNVRLIDYKAYCEIAEITKETKLSFEEYYRIISLNNMGPNTLLDYNNRFLNYDKQQSLWEEIDSKKIVTN